MEAGSSVETVNKEKLKSIRLCLLVSFILLAHPGNLRFQSEIFTLRKIQCFSERFDLCVCQKKEIYHDYKLQTRSN